MLSKTHSPSPLTISIHLRIVFFLVLSWFLLQPFLDYNFFLILYPPILSLLPLFPHPLFLLFIPSPLTPFSFYLHFYFISQLPPQHFLSTLITLTGLFHSTLSYNFTFSSLSSYIILSSLFFPSPSCFI